MTTAVLTEEKTPVTKSTDTRRVVIPEYKVNQGKDQVDITVLMPGVDEKNLDIRLEDRWLKVKGSPDGIDADGFQPLHREFAVRDYEVEFKAPPMIDVERISAKMGDGLLRLTLPKAESHQPRNIKVNAS